VTPGILAAVFGVAFGIAATLAWKRKQVFPTVVAVFLLVAGSVLALFWIGNAGSVIVYTGIGIAASSIITHLILDSLSH
jgi:hypothetical protein